MFDHIWAWRPSWTGDPDAANKLSFPLPKEATENLALIGQAVSEENTFETVDGRTDGGRTDDGRTDAGQWVSSYKLPSVPSAEVSYKKYPCKPHFYYIKVGCKGM